MPAVLLFHSRSSSTLMWVDPLTNWHKHTKADTGAIIHSCIEEVGEGCCVSMWVSYSGKKTTSYHAAPHSHAQTHVSTIKETHSPLLQKCLAMPPS